MALVLADRVRDTTTTTGTGTVTLSGTAPTGYQNFSVIGNGNTCYYTINGGSEWEVGIGTYSSTGPTLARTTVLSSSNSGSLVNFSAGTKDVFVTYPAGKSVNYDASNNVGIGIAPSTKLDVAGPIWSRSGGSVGAVAALFADASSGANGITLSASFVTGGYGPIKLDAGGSERARVDTSGNLLVGSTSTPSGNGTNLQVANSGAARLWLTSTGYRNFYLESSSGNALQFVDATAGAERMRINSSGNVGIGTSSPSSLLDVNGNAEVNGTLFLGASNHGNLASDSNTLYARGTNIAFQDAAGSGTYAYISSSGNLGIGDTAPAYKLTVAGDMRLTGGGDLRLSSATGTTTAGGDSQIYNDANNMIFTTGTTTAERMRIDSSGNLGVGTSTVDARLNVKGGTTWLQNFSGSASSPTETQDWPIPALNVTSYGDFTLQTMMTFTLPNDGNYFTGDSVWNFRLDQTASSTTSSGVNGMRFMGPGYLMFGPGTTEKARITSSGNWLVGTTSLAAGNWANEIKNTTTDAWPLALNATTRGMVIRNSSATSGFYAYFEYNGGTNNGSISWSGGVTSYNVTSDARIKKNITDAPDAGGLIDNIKVRSWDFKADGAHWRYGMVAQELLEVAPEAVSVPADPEMMMGVDYAKLVPMLIKEVQSLRARVAQLEGK